MPRAAAASGQLTSEELMQFKWLLGGVLTLLSVSTVFYLDIQAWLLMAAVTVAVGVGLWRPDWLARIPPWVHRLAFPVVVTVFVTDLWVTGELLPATVRLDLLLLLYRALVFRQKRDDLQLIVLGLFLVVLAGVLTVSLFFAVQILAFTALALVFLLTITLTEGQGLAGTAKKRGQTETIAEVADERLLGRGPAWARHVRWGRLLRRVKEVTRWRVVVLGAVLFAGLVGVAALLFLAIPRFQLENSFFLDRFVTKKARTGFSDTIRFGEVTEITQDDSVAASVDVSDRSRIPATPYWRMLVLDDYRDGTFRLSHGLRRTLGGEQSRSTVTGGAPRDGNDVFWTFYLESGVSRYLPLLGKFETLQFREPQNFQFGAWLGVVALRADPVTMLAYRVEGMRTEPVMPDRIFGERLRTFRESPRAAASLMLRVGLDDASEAALKKTVAEIAAGRPAATASEFSTRAAAWLGRHHAYSLQPRIPVGVGDPLTRWLTSAEAGHCELFAGSLVLLARTAGFPARVVTGFRGGSWNGYSNNFTLRNSDAHAWCEVYDLASASWMRVDPTPGASVASGADVRGEAALAGRLDRSWKARLDSLRVFWYRRIVSFDQQSQLDTLKAMKAVTAESGRRLRETWDRLRARLENWSRIPGGRARVAASVAAILALLAFGGRIGFRAWNRREMRRAPRRVHDRVRRTAGRWLREIGNAPSGAENSAAVMLLRNELQRLRYGPQESWEHAAEVFRRAQRAVRFRPRVVPAMPAER